MVVTEDYKSKYNNKSIDIKIKYFPFGGRGTALRLAAFIGNLTFEDEFTSFTDFKSIRHHKYIKWMTLPQIIVYDENYNEISVIGQSNACLRYIGFKCDLYPQNPIDAANCDEIMDYVEDIMSLLAPSEFCGDESEKKKLRKELSKYELPRWLEKLEWRLQENIEKGYNDGYIVGNNLSIADCKLYCFIRHFGHCLWREGYYKHIDENILDKFPLLTNYKIFMGNNEIIKQFNILWRERHKGFKLKDPKYPICFVWNKRIIHKNKYIQSDDDDDEVYYDNKNDKNYTILIVFAAILFLLFLLSEFEQMAWIPLIGIIFVGINETKQENTTKCNNS